MASLNINPTPRRRPTVAHHPHHSRRALPAAVITVLALAGCARHAQPTTGSSATGSSSASAATSAHSSPPVSTSVTPPASSTPAGGSSSGQTRPTPTSSATSTAPPPSIGGLLGKEWTRIPTSNRVVALTFDAGANADGVASILATLAAKQVPATFFLTGNWVNAFPNQARQIGSRYRLGDHSVSHPHFPQLTDAQLRAQVLDAAGTIRRVTGADPAPWFRFPYGDRNPRVISLVNSTGYVPIGWTVDTLGWEGTSSGITSDRVLQRVLDALTPGEIVLMHVGSNPTDHSTLDADTLPRLVEALRARGYGFVTLQAMLH